MKTFAIATLGCKVNTVESEDYINSLQQKGYQQVDFKEKADIYVINTCAVTQAATAKSRQKVSMAMRLNPQAQVVVVGCLVSTDPTELHSNNQDVILINQQQKQQFDQLVFKEQTPTPPTITSQHQTRAFLKIQDGCEQFCSFCIIPLARGKEQSVALEKLVDSARSLAQNKHKEIVLTGIHIGRYGKKDGEDLVSLCKRLCEIDEIKRIRISSIEVTEISDELIELIAKEPKLAKHLHIPLQSGSDSVLARMNRPYTTADYLNTLNKLRAANPDIAISTDIMAGFVGETQQEFEATKAFIKTCHFSFMHVFPYSIRKQTKAASMDNHVDPAIIKARAHELFELSKVYRHQSASSMIFKEVTVLFEKHTKSGSIGYSEQYFLVNVKEKVPLNQLTLVKIEGISDKMIVGRVVDA